MDRAAVGRAALTFALLLVGASAAAASIGVGVGRVPLTIAAAAVPGRTYRLHPDFYVVNTGDRMTTYRFQVQRLSAQSGTTLPAPWVSLAAPSRRLLPGQGARVAVTLHLPRATGSGTYVSDVVAAASGAAAGPRAVTVGAAAVTPIRFRVGGGRSGLAAILHRLRSGGILIGAVSLLLLAAAWRALGLRLVVERGGRQPRGR